MKQPDADDYEWANRLVAEAKAAGCSPLMLAAMVIRRLNDQMPKLRRTDP